MRIIGLDAGSVRTGISLADPSCTLASPYLIIHTNPISGFCARLAEALSSYPVERVIMGLPLDLRGREAESAALARQLGSLIEAELGWPVTYHDERFSSDLAAQAPSGRKRGGRGKPRELDAHAAAVILQGWLDYRKSGLDPDGGMS
ncbi:Holliday junction resolvase RuvX [bacterium]|nr:Holliday junction resolvase RuvX [bacterium]